MEQTVHGISKILISAFKNGNKVLICGNGGSASQSSHFAAELVSKFEHNREALPAISLTVDPAIITSISNDYGYEHVFSRQLEALSKPEDVLIVLSTSGKSKNCLMAIKWANDHGLKVIDWPRKGKGTADIQEKQLNLMHKVCRKVESAFI